MAREPRREIVDAVVDKIPNHVKRVDDKDTGELVGGIERDGEGYSVHGQGQDQRAVEVDRH